jgi:glycosyltransferase involved in cell wall biosynthesis
VKILFHTNACWTNSGYGQQAAQLAPRLVADGHDVAISAFHGLQSGVLEWHGIRCYPNGFEAYGRDTIIPHSEHWFKDEPGLILTLIDVWVLPPDALKGKPCACWTPVDSYPAAPRVVEFFKRSGARPIAMSAHGVKSLTEAGLDPLYAPHAIDMKVFAPGDREDAKRKFGWQDDFVVGMVAANQDTVLSSRKGWPVAFQAFAEFAKKHIDALLMCHTELQGKANGVNLPNLARACGIDPDRIVFAEPYPYRNGMYPPDYMAELYNAFDVFLNPALGEGFGIPILEAQACGTPVITTDWTAMSELSTAGWAVEGEKVWSVQEAWWKMPHVSAVVDALEQAYDQAGGKREAAREFALQYDADLVFEKHWKPILDELEPSPSLDRAAGPMGSIPKAVDPLLTIYVPTFQRHELEDCLAALSPQVTEEVEIIISDNDPEASAERIVKTELGTNADYSARATNIGGNANILRGLTEGSAPYIWVIGDDDVLLPGAIEQTLEIIREHRPDRILHYSPEAKGRVAAGHVGTMASLIEELGDDPSFLIAATLITCNVWRRDIVDFAAGFDHLETSYPHIWATMNAETVVVADEPAISVGCNHPGDLIGWPRIYQEILDEIARQAGAGEILLDSATRWNFLSVGLPELVVV